MKLLIGWYLRKLHEHDPAPGEPVHKQRPMFVQRSWRRNRAVERGYDSVWPSAALRDGNRKFVQLTRFPAVNTLLHALLPPMQRIVDQNLVGVYLYGSLVTGDFDLAISDIDLLAVTHTDLDTPTFERLDALHAAVARDHPVWNNRIEIAYVSVTALQTYKTRSSTIAVISPGEPFHHKEAGKDWLINWWVVRNYGVALLGPAPTAIIAPISRPEFVQAVRAQAEEWRDYIVHTRSSRPYQAYAILTLCRALYAYTHGEQVSKQQAAVWARQQLPAWASLIDDALRWRAAWREQVADPEATYAQTARFVHFVVDQMRS